MTMFLYRHEWKEDSTNGSLNPCMTQVEAKSGKANIDWFWKPLANCFHSWNFFLLSMWQSFTPAWHKADLWNWVYNWSFGSLDKQKRPFWMDQHDLLAKVKCHLLFSDGSTFYSIKCRKVRHFKTITKIQNTFIKIHILFPKSLKWLAELNEFHLRLLFQMTLYILIFAHLNPFVLLCFASWLH